MFAANTVAWWAPRIRAGDVVRWPYGAVETAPIDERDIAAVAVRALSDASLAGVAAERRVSDAGLVVSSGHGFQWAEAEDCRDS
jgi:hypothetical protein